MWDQRMREFSMVMVSRMISSASTAEIMHYNSAKSKMSYSGRYRSPSRSPHRHGTSLSRSRSRSRSRDSSMENPGNNLYVTGMSPRITKEELERHFASEGKVTDIHLVTDPWTRESRGFGFVTMATLEDADHCIKYLDRSVLDGRVITVEKARRRRGRTPTPGRYLGLRTVYETWVSWSEICNKVWALVGRCAQVQGPV